MTYTWKFGENCGNVCRIKITKFFTNVTSSKFSNSKQSSKGVFYFIARDFSFDIIFVWSNNDSMLSNINNVKWFLLIQIRKSLTFKFFDFSPNVHSSPLNAPPIGRSTDGSNVRPKSGRNSSSVADCNSRSDAS